MSNFPIVKIDDEVKYKSDIGYRQLLHFFSDNNSLIRRSVWIDYPYPDVDFAEDQLWAKTVIESGFKKGYAHDAIVYHSHKYTLFERLQRSFDEAYAFNKFFGYELCPSPSHLFVNWLKLNYHDFLYLFKMKFEIQNFKYFFLSPIDNLMKLCGHFLGNHSHLIPFGFIKYFSRDKRLFEK